MSSEDGHRVRPSRYSQLLIVSNSLVLVSTSVTSLVSNEKKKIATHLTKIAPYTYTVNGAVTDLLIITDRYSYYRRKKNIIHVQ